MEPPLTNQPILLFLHGVGDGDQSNSWSSCLSDSLTRIEYPDLGTISVIAPKFANALKGSDEEVPLPAVTIKQPVRDAAAKNRRDFERREGAIEFRLGRNDRGSGQIGGDVVINTALGLPFFKQAHNYLNKPDVRSQVLTRILSKLPDSGRLVIVGHSLGSVIAADLLRRLPVGLEVVGMVTIGSPLANGNFNVDKLRESMTEPPTNLAWWVNFWDANDSVAARRGVSSSFPWLIDLRVDGKKLMPQAHAAVEYLSDARVAEAIGFALFGSKSKELAYVEKALDVPLDDAERLVLLALRYSYLIKMRLEGDLKERYAGALRQVQATVIEGIRQRNEHLKRPMPSAVADLAFDLSDPNMPVPEPVPSSHLPKDDAVIALTVLAAENIIRPFEITIPKDTQQAALQDLAAEMGLGSQYGADVFDSAKLAQETLSGRRMNWLRWGLLGAGAAAIVVATGGLALAAGAGLAGAALVTSALATFGPGGMIGGLLTAGTLVAAGGGGIAFSLASPGITAETLEAVIERQLAAAILRQKQHLKQDSAVWRNLVETEIQVRRERERLDEFSDESAPLLKELKRKLDVIERALKYLNENGIAPEADI